MDTRIYVMTHKTYVEVDNPIYRSLHVGCETGTDLGYEGDNQGDNISTKNPHFCELTGLYYIWKNVNCDIVGICHYRRFFLEKEDFISKEKIEELLSDNDVIIPLGSCVTESSVREQYCDRHYEKDWIAVKDIVRQKYPNYVDAFELMENTCFINPYNMMITKKAIFDEYCEFIFSVLFELEKRIDISEYDNYQARVFGFISERLFRVWLLMHTYKIHEQEVRMVDTGTCYNYIVERDLKYKYVSKVLEKMTERYMAGDCYDVVDNSPLDINFYEKMPIWVCWFQGYDDAPELVKTCINSLDKHVDEDKAIIYLITMDNIGEFLTLPQWIIDKYLEGKITLTHLSDIIRMGLLYRYGGLWIDATYYVVEDLEKHIYSTDEFFTIKTGKNIYRGDITEGRWSGNFMKGASGNLLFKFVLNALYEYWRVSDDLIDYYLIDYIIKLAYNQLQGIKEMIDGCPVSQIDTLDLLKVLDRKYDVKYFERLKETTSIFKLSHKKECQKANFAGEKTYYGMVIDSI